MHNEDAKSRRDKKDNAIHGSLPTVTGLHSSFLDNAKKLPSIKQRQGNERNELRHEMLLERREIYRNIKMICEK